MDGKSFMNIHLHSMNKKTCYNNGYNILWVSVLPEVRDAKKDISSELK